MNKDLYMCVRVCVNVIISGFETACHLNTGKRRRFTLLLQRWGFKILTENQVPYVSDYRSCSITVISRHIAHAWVRPPPLPPHPTPAFLVQSSCTGVGCTFAFARCQSQVRSYFWLSLFFRRCHAEDLLHVHCLVQSWCCLLARCPQRR